MYTYRYVCIPTNTYIYIHIHQYTFIYCFSYLDVLKPILLFYIHIHTYDINTIFFSKIHYFFLQNATFFSKLNSALFDRSHCSRMRSETMC